jgi:hypothetical protein
MSFSENRRRPIEVINLPERYHMTIDALQEIVAAVRESGVEVNPDENDSDGLYELFHGADTLFAKQKGDIFKGWHSYLKDRDEGGTGNEEYSISINFWSDSDAGGTNNTDFVANFAFGLPSPKDEVSVTLHVGFSSATKEWITVLNSLTESIEVEDDIKAEYVEVEDVEAEEEEEEEEEDIESLVQNAELAPEAIDLIHQFNFSPVPQNISEGEALRIIRELAVFFTNKPGSGLN